MDRKDEDDYKARKSDLDRAGDEPGHAVKDAAKDASESDPKQS